MHPFVENILRCPCPKKAELIAGDDSHFCTSASCPYGTTGQGFSTCAGAPVLIAFDLTETVCSKDKYDKAKSSGFYVARKSRVPACITRIVSGKQTVTISNCRSFIKELLKRGNSGKVLVIGSGQRGKGTDELWNDSRLSLVGTDIYPSATVDYIADAHFLPFADGSFDGVWIQAVLEHVVDPSQVAKEIFRVLRSGGVLYAETPFMQQVHEGAYDFTRYTVVGHRALFRQFKAMSIGPIHGPATVFAWSIKYLVWALTRSVRCATLVFLPVLLVARLVDALLPERAKWDGPSGVYFLGIKEANFEFSVKSLPHLYQGLQ